MGSDRELVLSTLAKIHSFEEKLGVAPGTLPRILDDDDWSAIIKCHALVEASVAWLLRSVTDPRLEKVFSKLALGNRGSGKLAFAKALNLLADNQQDFIQVLSELRNHVAHDPRAIGFTFANYIPSLSERERQSFFARLVGMGAPQFRERDVARAEQDPKEMMLWSAILLVLEIASHDAVLEAHHRDRVFGIVEKFLDSEFSDENVAKLAADIHGA